MSKVRWGVMSTADIGLTKVVPAMMRGRNIKVVSIASRNTDKARAAAEKLGLKKSRIHGSYEALLADPDIDAVYIPLPNHLHVPWAIKAVEAGKHVLCEKPIGLNSGEARQLMDAAAERPDLKVMEAFMYRHHPQWKSAKEILESGGIGEPRTIQSFFSYYNDDPGNIRNKADIGGGAMMDIGCYCISLSRYLFDAEPKRVCGLMDQDPRFGTDRMFSGMMDFGDRTSAFTCGTQLEDYQRMNVFGDKGRVEIVIPFNAPPDEPCLIHHQLGDTIQTRTMEICDQYTLQGEVLSQAILEDAPVPTPLDDAWKNMLVLEAFMESARSGGWVEL